MWQKNLLAQLGQALGQVALGTSIKRRQKRIDPSEGDQAHPGLQRTRPVPTFEWRIVLHPIFQPIEGMLTTSLVAH